MFVELIELLRCPNPHEPTHLVAAATHSEARHIVEGTLGCPACGAEFPIVASVTRFVADATLATHADPSPEAAMRLAAFLDLSDARGFAVLCGRWAAHAAEVQRIAQTPLVLVNAATAAERQDVSAALRVGARLPFAADAIRAIAVDETLHPAAIESAVRALRPRGRMMAPAGMPIPAGVAELVRDEWNWVGEKTAAAAGTPRLVELRRGTR